MRRFVNNSVDLFSRYTRQQKRWIFKFLVCTSINCYNEFFKNLLIVVDRHKGYSPETKTNIQNLLKMYFIYLKKSTCYSKFIISIKS